MDDRADLVDLWRSEHEAGCMLRSAIIYGRDALIAAAESCVAAGVDPEFVRHEIIRMIGGD